MEQHLYAGRVHYEATQNQSDGNPDGGVLIAEYSVFEYGHSGSTAHPYMTRLATNIEYQHTFFHTTTNCTVVKICTINTSLDVATETKEKMNNQH